MYVVRVLPCSLNTVNPYHVPCSSKPKASLPTKQIKLDVEPDYGKGMKQLSYVIGMSILGISSIVLGTRGKICSSIKL